MNKSTTNTPSTDAKAEVEFWKAKAYEAEASEGKHEAEVEHIKKLLKDISAVHINTLRGNIATLSWDSYEHIIGPHPCRERAEKAEAEVERLKEELDNIKASTIHTCHEKCKRPMCQLSRELAKSKALCSVQYKAIQRLEKESKLKYWKEKAFSYCERAEKAKAEVERLRSTMRSFIDFIDENLGTTADWPMEAAFDDEETCQRHCDLLNAMKRLVKPEGIN